MLEVEVNCGMMGKSTFTTCFHLVGNRKLRLYSHLVRLQLSRMLDRDYVVIMTPKVDD